jgi:hypothetical protein
MERVKMSILVISLSDLNVSTKIKRFVHRWRTALTVPNHGVTCHREFFYEAMSSVVSAHAWRIRDIGGDLTEVHVLY